MEQFCLVIGEIIGLDAIGDWKCGLGCCKYGCCNTCKISVVHLVDTESCSFCLYLKEYKYSCN